MNSNLTRREFLTATALAVAAAPELLAQEKTVTIAFVGCAHIHTPGFVDLLKGRKDVKVKWVWDHDTARAEKSAKKIGTEVVSDINRIWSDPEIQAVVI